MFKRFREKIERALERREAERPLTRDDIDQLLYAMRDELVDLRARIPRLEKEAKRVAEQAQQQVRRAELAHRKAQEAERAGRADEASSALDLARQALSHAEDLRTQAAEARAQLEELKAEAKEKTEQLKYAERNRGALLARARRTGTAQRLDDLLRGPESGLKRFERAEEDIDAAEDLLEATREVDEALGTRSPARELEADVELRRLEAASEADEVEQRLLELKRQLEEEGD